MKTEKIALLFLAFFLMISSEAECAWSGSSVGTVRLVFTDFKTYFKWLYIIFYKGLYITRTQKSFSVGKCWQITWRPVEGQ